MAPSLCGSSVSSRRALLASLWSIVTILTAISFLTALTFTMRTKQQLYDDNYNNGYNYNQEGEGKDGDEQEEEQEQDPEIAVTSRAMAFAALWTAVLATLMTVFGTVVLGWQSPTGQYYTCCSSNVHRTTPLSLGSFIGALLMFSNLTLVCSVLFGEFEIRDYQRQGQADGDRENGNRENEFYRDTAVDRSSMAFSIMCMFLTVLYAGFAALTFSFSHSVIEEHQADQREEALNSARSLGGQHHHHHHHFATTGNGQYDGYIGERFDVVPRRPTNVMHAGAGGVGVVPGSTTSHTGGFVGPTPNDVPTLT